ncbi:MAG: ABC transporter ATP-binding protein [Butyrivibrio sp.]|nr:ABC transporter ATP-binding protein [Butyrivibrio sp.]
MEKKILELKKITKQFGGIKAATDVDLVVREGEIHGLIGPNGAGKTTIFKLITGLYSPTYGRVYLGGKDITRLPAHKRAQMGLSIKMQIPGVYEDLTLRENIRIAAQLYTGKKELEAEIDRLIKLVKIDDLGNPKVRNLSHGQQQWLEIAMSLASHPKVLLLDEPAAGMGPEETTFTAELVKDLNKQGLTIVFIEHDMDFVSLLAQNVTVLHYGKIFAEGDMEEIKNNKEVQKIYLGAV